VVSVTQAVQSMNMMFAIPSRELVSSLVPALNARFWQYIDISLINKQAIELFDYPWAPSSQHSMQGLPLLADGLRFYRGLPSNFPDLMREISGSKHHSISRSI
jgi:hypothetical protein